MPHEIYDRDGDLWWRDGQMDAWYLLGDYSLPRSIAEVNELFGPLTKVVE